MKVLIVPMAAMAETGGPSTRCRSLVSAFSKAGIDVATCMAEDLNYKKIEGIKNYYLSVPMPLGLPAFIAKKTFPMARKLGLTTRKSVKSFDQVLYYTGNLDHGYLKKSVSDIREAIKEFDPDVVYSEFNISAMIAAKLEGRELFATTSYPTQHEYANEPGLAKGLNRFLRDNDLPEVESALKLIDMADKTFCPGIEELEPIYRENIYFCGSIKNVIREDKKRDKILVYMGNGTVSPKKMLNILKKSFSKSEYEVYFASNALKSADIGNIHVAPFWDFNSMLDEAVLYINHGGQNSIVDGLIHGVPQLVIPGKIFERKYNAMSISDNNAGIFLSAHDLETEKFLITCKELIDSKEVRRHAKELGDKFLSAGGIDIIINELNN